MRTCGLQFANAPAMLDVKQWSSNMECVFISTLSVACFNNDYSAWESLIQKHDINVKVVMMIVMLLDTV